MNIDEYGLSVILCCVESGDWRLSFKSCFLLFVFQVASGPVERLLEIPCDIMGNITLTRYGIVPGREGGAEPALSISGTLI
jgi:hypothetical protein